MGSEGGGVEVSGPFFVPEICPSKNSVLSLFFEIHPFSLTFEMYPLSFILTQIDPPPLNSLRKILFLAKNGKKYLHITLYHSMFIS